MSKTRDHVRWREFGCMVDVKLSEQHGSVVSVLSVLKIVAWVDAFVSCQSIYERRPCLGRVFQRLTLSKPHRLDSNDRKLGTGDAVGWTTTKHGIPSVASL